MADLNFMFAATNSVMALVNLWLALRNHRVAKANLRNAERLSGSDTRTSRQAPPRKSPPAIRPEDMSVESFKPWQGGINVNPRPTYERPAAPPAPPPLGQQQPRGNKP